MADDDEQRYERFDVDNDFEGGQWIGGEYFYDQKVKKRQQTRDDAIYGIFASDSDDSEGGRRGRKRDRGGGDRGDLTKPVAFVSTGQVVQQTLEDDETPAIIVKRAREASPDERPGLGSSTAGLGAGGGGGLGFTRSSAAAAAAAANRPGMLDVNGSDEEEVLPSAFGRRIKAAAEARRRREEVTAASTAGGGAGAGRGAAGGAPADPKFAAFEKHTKGIGLKLLKSMGYTPGEGLGKNKSGISRPVEPKMRPKGMGMGFGDFTEQGLAPAPAAKPKAGTSPPPEVPGLKDVGKGGEWTCLAFILLHSSGFVVRFMSLQLSGQRSP